MPLASTWHLPMPPDKYLVQSTPTPMRSMPFCSTPTLSMVVLSWLSSSSSGSAPALREPLLWMPARRRRHEEGNPRLDLPRRCPPRRSPRRPHPPRRRVFRCRLPWRCPPLSRRRGDLTHACACHGGGDTTRRNYDARQQHKHTSMIQITKTTKTTKMTHMTNNDTG